MASSLIVDGDFSHLKFIPSLHEGGKYRVRYGASQVLEKTKVRKCDRIGNFQGNFQGTDPRIFPRNGNRYLAWAFVEAANFARRASPEINAWAQRKEARSGKHVIAVKALANKLAKAAYFIMKNKEPFDLKRIL